ncbi:gamma-aminobutyric acid type B receptor subunit 2-like [Diadema antillarum]|uniref:gamma-aminobutyric acid type B receptor subunit 2-like n=1 Tax=Diadema antillarum TaxID=105358 RepID=UPI003A83B8B9
MPSPVDDADVTAVLLESTVINEQDRLTESPGGASGEKIPLYLAGFFSVSGGWDASGVLPAVEMALDHVNERPDILPDYEIKMVWNDTQCEAGLGTRVLFNHLFHTPQKIIIIGPACSTAAQAVAATAYHWNLVTVSYSAASPELSDRSKYPYFFRLTSDDKILNAPRLRLLQRYGWSRVATIHENHELFSLAIDHILTLLKEANITIIASESFSESPRNQVANLKLQDTKIIIANMYESPARRLLCEAWLQGMTGRDHVWFMIGWYTDGWYLQRDDTLDTRCTPERMKEAVENVTYISVEGINLGNDHDLTISGLTAKSYEQAYYARFNLPENRGKTPSLYGAPAYDAVWAIALMLNRTASALQTSSSDRWKRLEDFNYDDNELGRLFFDNLNTTEFRGVTGTVTFKDGDRITDCAIKQLKLGCKQHREELNEEAFLSGSMCIRFVNQIRTWSEARIACLYDHGEGLILAPMYERVDIELMVKTVMEERPDDIALYSRWWLGLYVNTSGEVWRTSLSGEEKLSEVNLSDTWTSISSPSAPGCVVVDLNQGVDLLVVDCSKMYPYICSRQAEYSQQRIGRYYTLDDDLRIDTEVLFPGGVIPPDRTPEVIRVVNEMYLGITLRLYIVMASVAFLGIVMAVVFFCFNVRFRDQKFVKLSSPNLNNLIILGSVMAYAWIFVYGLDKNIIGSEGSEKICMARNWIISLGFVSAFGAMFSKTWRVHRVASFKTPKRRIVRDEHLYLMVFVLVIIDFGILLSWQILDPMDLHRKMLYSVVDPHDHLSDIQPYIEYCSSVYINYWMIAIYCYKGLLLVFGAFLAWETRKVTIPALNDSKLIGICVYNVVILSCIGVGVSFALIDDRASLFIFLSLIVIFCTTITLLVVFVPKMISVYKDPAGENATGKKPGGRGVSSLVNIGGTLGSERASQNQAEVIQNLKEKIKVLEAKLKKEGSAPQTMNEAGGNVCGLRCMGLFCGCSCRNGCAHLDNEGEASVYTLTHDGNTEDTKHVYLGHRAKTEASTSDVALKITSHDVHSCAPGLRNGGYIADSDDGEHSGGAKSSRTNSPSRQGATTTWKPIETNSPSSTATASTAQAASGEEALPTELTSPPSNGRAEAIQMKTTDR